MLYKILLLVFLMPLSILQANNSKFLTLTERQWIDSLHNDITIGITQIPNQVLLSDNNSYKGLSIDLFHLIEEKSHLPLRYVYFDSWEKLMQAAKSNQIDIVFFAQKTTSRLQYLYFTDTVLTLQNKLIVNIDKQFHTLEELKNHKLAITAGSALEEYIKYYYPDIIVIPTKDELQSLEFVEQKKVDATILELVRASYYMRTHNLNDLVISSDIEYNYYLSIASTKKLPELNIILSKTLKEIKSSEIAALKLKWGYIKEKKLFFDKQTMIYLAIAFGIIIPFSLYLFIINRKLHTEMQEKKKALSRVTKLRDSKLNEMSEIISMIAHQWRQPLNNLSVLNQLLLSKHKKNILDDKAIEYVYEKSKSQIDVMSKTIDDFRDLFQITEKKETFDLKVMIMNLLNVMQPVLQKHNISIIFHAVDENYYVYNYQSMLFQILMNVINNAKDALVTTDKGEKKIEITLLQTQEGIIIYIQDNGGGIDESIIDKIFDPYFSTKGQKNGTGLGLYMAKIILQERMDGDIYVENQQEGALFTIKLT